LDPIDKKWVVGHGQVEGVIGKVVHFKRIEERLCKVVVWHVMEGNIPLFE
jgi:hypothetical protein